MTSVHDSAALDDGRVELRWLNAARGVDDRLITSLRNRTATPDSRP
ncbi:hypothetical protein ABT300_42235 [Streptomyces sp. NPDC001027]